jgi:hypothetical protein
VAVEAPVLAAAPVGHLQQSRLPTRQSWLWCVVAVTVGAFAVSIVAAPPADATPARGLSWLLFVGSSVHIAATGWLFSFRDVRSHARQHLARYVVAPVALIAAGGAIVGLLSLRHLDVMLLGYFGWQFLHYQKQNLGLAALAASSRCAASLTTTERKAIMATGWMGIAALMLHPGTLQLPLNPHLGWYPGVPFHLAAIGFAGCALAGVVALLRRPRADRPIGVCVVYLSALFFPLPIFVFSSPYSAVGGMTIAHGLQYLVLVGLVAAGPPNHRASLSRLTGFIVAALMVGSGLNLASHLHTGGTLARVVYGAYLGVVMAHFAVDAGIWRLRDPFPRQFLSARAPYLLGFPADPATDASPTGVV